MKCPQCSSPLSKIDYRGIEVEHCENCGGTWFDTHEIDQLEDTVFDQDDSKNTMVTNVQTTEIQCPKCSAPMKKFNYRWEDLELEMCPVDHGFWLDKGEEKRVLEHIESYANDLERKQKAEKEWNTELSKLQSPSFFDKVKDLFE